MAKEEPSKFVQACLTLMPREVALEVNGPLSTMSDEELTDALDAVRRLKAEMAQPVIEIARAIPVADVTINGGAVPPKKLTVRKT